VEVDSEDRTKQLPDGVLAVSSGVDPVVTPRKVVQAAVDLVGARHGAVGCTVSPQGPTGSCLWEQATVPGRC